MIKESACYNLEGLYPFGSEGDLAVPCQKVMALPGVPINGFWMALSVHWSAQALVLVFFLGGEGRALLGMCAFHGACVRV